MSTYRQFTEWLFSDSFEAPACPWLIRGFVGALFALGTIHWLLFWSVPDPFYRGFDWPKERTYYLLIGKCWGTRTIPWHADQQLRDCNKKGQTTDRFLAIPETLSPLSPQSAFLEYLDPRTFVLINTWILFGLGTLGLCLLAIRKGWSPAGFFLAFFLWGFNGHLTAHLSVGHSMWVGVFLLPWLALALDRVEKDPRPHTGVLIALALFALILQGSFHLFATAELFLALALLFPSNYRRPILVGILLALGFGAFRLVPAGMTFQALEFVGGFPNLQTIIKGLTAITPWNAPRDGPGLLGHWEFDNYIGPIGLFFLVWYGFIRPIQREGAAEFFFRRPTTIPFGVLAILSFGEFYWFSFGNLPVSFFESQRIPSRLLLFPLLGLTVSAATELSLAFRRSHSQAGEESAIAHSSPNTRSSLFLALVIMVFFLFAHSRVWSLGRIEPNFSKVRIDWDHQPSIIFRQDLLYLQATLIAYFFSGTLLLLALLWFWWRNKQLAPFQEPSGAALATPSLLPPSESASGPAPNVSDTQD